MSKAYVFYKEALLNEPQQVKRVLNVYANPDGQTGRTNTYGSVEPALLSRQKHRSLHTLRQSFRQRARGFGIVYG